MNTRPISTLLVFGVSVLCHQVLGQHFVQQTVTKNQQDENPNFKQVLLNENLFEQFKQWQQETQHQTKNNYGNNYGSGQYEGNPWIKPTPSTTTPPPYIEPNPYPGNYWNNPGPQPGGYYPVQTQSPPANNGAYPPSTTKPPQYGGYYPAPPQNGGYLPPTETPEVAALRKYCLKPRGQFPSKSCNKYVNCWDDSVIEQECPAGLLFSELGYCDYDYNVDCKGRATNPVTPRPTMPPKGGKCPTLFGNYRSKSNCSEFFVCNHGIPIKFCCPADLYYNTELGVCDYPYNVDCINPRPLHPEPITPTHEIPNPGWIINNNNNYPYNLQRVHADLVDQEKSCVPNSIYRLSEDCSTVAICKHNGRTEVVKCGPQTAYDAEKGTCIAKHLAYC